MFLFFSVLILLPAVKASKSEDLIVFDNFDYGGMEFGSEENVVDFATLANDRTMDLPPSFTVCSSVHSNFMTSGVYFYQLHQDDGKPWFNLNIRAQRDLNTFQERIKLRYGKILQDSETTPNIDPLPIMSNSWYHGCAALNTVTGHIMLIVVNGHIIFDQVILEFTNSIEEKPKSLDDRLSIFKNYNSGIWYQSRQRLTNLNIYGSALTVDKMINLTHSENCSEEGDYLSWADAQWNVTGNVDQNSTVKKEDLCYSSISNIVLFTDIFHNWEECMLFCEKFPSTRSPSVASEKEFLAVMRAVERILIDPETGNLNPGVLSYGYWIPVTDSRIEGKWVDFYTSAPVDIAGVAAGEPNGGVDISCGIIVTLWRGWVDWPCTVTSANTLQCPCESKGQIILTMRGLCSESNIDKYFVPQNKEYHGQTLFHGLYKTIIEYHEADSLWHLRVAGVRAALACSIVSESFCPNLCRSKSSMTILSLSL